MLVRGEGSVQLLDRKQAVAEAYDGILERLSLLVVGNCYSMNVESAPKIRLRRDSPAGHMEAIRKARSNSAEALARNAKLENPPAKLLTWL